ncbi:MAG: Pycsar system effector family protein [Adhaeribacter sp.]
MSPGNEIPRESETRAENLAGQEMAARPERAEKKKGNKKGRGVETMFRVMSSNNMRLSRIADEKAHFLLTINSIIISVLVSVVLRKIDEWPYYLIPTFIFLVTSLITFIQAILVTIPIITHGIFHKAEVENKTADLLFFGNYHNMDMQEYEWAMKTMLKDSDFVYGSMIRDNYHLGQVLYKKYRRLRLAFALFMFGFTISVLAFLVAEYIWK